MVTLIFTIGGIRCEKQIRLDGNWNLDNVEYAIERTLPEFIQVAGLTIEYEGALVWRIYVEGRLLGSVRARAETGVK
jgi:hypothetical protein